MTSDVTPEPTEESGRRQRHFSGFTGFAALGLKQRLGRRGVVAGLATLSISFLTGWRSLDRSHSPRPAPDTAAGAATLQEATPETPPTATPVPPTATPEPPTPTPVPPTPTPNPTGVLEVIRDQRPTYPESPLTSEHLSLFLSQADNSDFNPTAFRQDFQIPVSYLDPLVAVDEVTMEPKPWLAESWSWNDSSTDLTITVRTDIRWHDGSPLTAKDVRFSLTLYRDDVDSGVGNIFALIESIEEVGEQRVRVSFTSPDGLWLLNGATQPIFQEAQYADYWNARPEGERTLAGFDWQQSPPIGTGPWKIAQHEPGALTFNRNEEYWAGPAPFTTMSLTWEPDPARRLDAWKQGQVDLLWPLSVADLPAVRDLNGRLYVADAASVMFAAFNFANPVREVPDLFADVRVRNALSLAVNRPRYATDVFGGFFQPDKAGTIAQPWAHDDTVANPPRDPAAARDLLLQAGWEDRDGDGVLENAAGQRFAISIIVRNDSRPELLAIVQSIVADMQEIGVALEARMMAPDRFRDSWINVHDFDLIAYAYNLFPGFTDFDLYGSSWDIRINPQGWNPGGYANTDVDALIFEILTSTDLTAQKSALSQFQIVTNSDLFALWFGFPQDLILVRPDILGFQPNKLWQTLDTRKLWRQPQFV